MNVIEHGNSVIVKNIKDFDAKQTFLCGQCFRWEQETNGSFTGVAYGKAVNIKTDGNNLILNGSNKEDFENIWRHYLDLDNDYSNIKSSLSDDSILEKAIAYGWGIRILNQDVFECVISFIISAQNSIPRIKKIVKKLCEMYGEKIVFDGRDYYAFPTPEVLSELGEDDLAPLKAGYRAAYVLDAARKVHSKEVDIYNLKNITTGDARKELLKIKGVGPKVADCTLLFSAQKGDSFPIDVWIGRIMRYLYLGDDATNKQIAEFSNEKFGQLSGIAQQYLFYYARENGIGA